MTCMTYYMTCMVKYLDFIIRCHARSNVSDSSYMTPYVFLTQLFIPYLVYEIVEKSIILI